MSHSLLDLLAGKAVDRATQSLAEDAGYLDPLQKPDVRYLPSAELLELLAWNVVVAFSVSLAASFAFDSLAGKQAAKKREEALKTRVTKLSEVLAFSEGRLIERDRCIELLHDICNELVSNPPARFDKKHPEVDVAGIVLLLRRNGWGEREAHSRAEEIVAKLLDQLRQHQWT